MEKKYVIKEANEFSEEVIERFKTILINAGEVIESSFDNLIKRNPILLFYPNTLDIEAIGALKRPNKSYKENVFSKSKTEFDSDTFEYELGWIVSNKRGQGIGKYITKLLSDYKPRVYTTARDENETMNHILELNGFRKSGFPYNSEKGNYKINLYTKKSYSSFSGLLKNETEFSIIVQDRKSKVTIMVLHGGKMEPGTSEIAERIAGNEYNLFLFNGNKTNNNSVLHIPSHKYDFEPALNLAYHSEIVITIHGCSEKGNIVFIGGLEDKFKKILKSSFMEFNITTSLNEKYLGENKNNICNKGITGKGLQLELTKYVRENKKEEIILGVKKAINKFMNNSLKKHYSMHKSKNILSKNRNLKKNRFIDNWVFETLARPQYDQSCSISSITSGIRYLTLKYYEQEEIASLLNLDINGSFNPGNSTITKWVKEISKRLDLSITAKIRLQNGFEQETKQSKIEWDSITQKLLDRKSFLILHIEGHYLPIIGFGEFGFTTNSTEKTTKWIILADPSQEHNQSKIKSQHLDLSPPIWSMRWREIGGRLKEYKNYAIIELGKIKKI